MNIMIFLTLLLFCMSLLIVTKGADWFVDSAVIISEKRGIPKIIIGATIVSFATTSPEFSVSASAALMNHTDMAVGNAVGSVICNIGLILGSVLTMKGATIDKDTFLKKGFFMLLSGIVLLVLSLDGIITSVDGIILLLIIIAFLYYNYKLQHSIFQESNQTSIVPLSQMRKEIFFFFAGAIFVIGGSQILISTGIDIAHLLGIPEMLISLTLIAFGTSLPEFITALSSTLKGHQDLSIGNIIGANTMDISMILGVCTFISPLPILPQSIRYDLPVMIILMLLLLILGVTKRRFDRWEGALLFIVYGAYIFGLFMFYT